MSDPISGLEVELEEVRREFERYFLGVEKRLPARQRDEINRKIKRFDAGHDAVSRFRHQNLIQRLNVLEQYWNRILRAIEEGTYIRDVKRADWRESRDGKAAETPTAERAALASQRAAETADEAEAFLAALGAGPTPTSPVVSMRGAPKAGEPVSRVPRAGEVPLRGAPRRADPEAAATSSPPGSVPPASRGPTSLPPATRPILATAPVRRNSVEQPVPPPPASVASPTAPFPVVSSVPPPARPGPTGPAPVIAGSTPPTARPPTGPSPVLPASTPPGSGTAPYPTVAGPRPSTTPDGPRSMPPLPRLPRPTGPVPVTRPTPMPGPAPVARPPAAPAPPPVPAPAPAAPPVAARPPAAPLPPAGVPMRGAPKADPPPVPMRGRPKDG